MIELDRRKTRSIHNNPYLQALPGNRVIVYSPHYDDWMTATVIRRYSILDGMFGQYADVVDVQLDYDGRVSRSHFSSGVRDYNP